MPCLVTEDGLALFDSPVICEYLDSVGGGALFPPPGAARWRALKQQAMADGIMDAAVVAPHGSRPAREEARAASWTRQKAAIVAHARSTLLERDPPHDHVDIGTIASPARSATSISASPTSPGAAAPGARLLVHHVQPAQGDQRDGTSLGP